MIKYLIILITVFRAKVLDVLYEGETKDVDSYQQHSGISPAKSAEGIKTLAEASVDECNPVASDAEGSSSEGKEQGALSVLKQHATFIKTQTKLAQSCTSKQLFVSSKRVAEVAFEEDNRRKKGKTQAEKNKKRKQKKKRALKRKNVSSVN